MLEKVEVMNTMKTRPKLQYKISNWRQLTKCMSNNDRALKITVTDFVNNPYVRGLRISVIHPQFGTLFSELLDASGTFISTDPESGAPETAYQLSTTTILKELYKFGFLVQYEPRESLPDTTLQYLRTLKNLKFDKLRILNVEDIDFITIPSYKWYVVGFLSGSHPRWLDNLYVASKKEFTDALLHGTAINISELCDSKDVGWSWLDYVANIDDILAEYEGGTSNGG